MPSKSYREERTLLFEYLPSARHSASISHMWLHFFLPHILRDGDWYSHFTDNVTESQTAEVAPQGHTSSWHSKADLCDLKAFHFKSLTPKDNCLYLFSTFTIQRTLHLLPHLIFTKALDKELTTRKGSWGHGGGEGPKFIIHSHVWLLWSPTISTCLVNEWTEKWLYNQSAICPGWYCMNNLCSINTAG